MMMMLKAIAERYDIIIAWFVLPQLMSIVEFCKMTLWDMTETAHWCVAKTAWQLCVIEQRLQYGKYVLHDIHVDTTSNVYEVELCFIFFNIPWETCQFFMNIYFKNGTLSPTHFLNFPIGVSGQCQGVGNTTLLWVGVDAIDGDYFSHWVI